MRVSPLVATSTTPRTSRLRLPATPAWSVLLLPDRYQIQVDSKGAAWVVPDPLILPHKPGVNGVTSTRVRTPDGRTVRVGDPSAVLSIWRDHHGAIEVPREYPVHAHGEEHESWLAAYSVPAGVHHCWAWELPIATAAGTRVERDDDARIRWLASVGQTYLGPVGDHVLGALRADLERDVMRARTRMERSPSHRAIYQRGQAALSAMGWIEGVEARRGDIDGAPVLPSQAPPIAEAYLSGLSTDQLRALLEARTGGDSAPEPAPAPAPKRRRSRKTSPVVAEEGAAVVGSESGPSDLGPTTRL